jgi:hypothetical protein
LEEDLAWVTQLISTYQEPVAVSRELRGLRGDNADKVILTADMMRHIAQVIRKRIQLLTQQMNHATSHTINIAERDRPSSTRSRSSRSSSSSSSSRPEPIPKTKTSFLKFDRPGFDLAKFHDLMPRLSPKCTKLEFLLQKCPHQVIIYCHGISSIRAVAGTLLTLRYAKGIDEEWNLLPPKPSQFLILSKSSIGAKPLTEEAKTKIIHAFQQQRSQYKIILIDHHFKEGVDLPASDIILFDEPTSRAELTQIVGRANRYCGLHEDLFLQDGWTIHVHRLGIRFFHNRLRTRNNDTLDLDHLIDLIPRPQHIHDMDDYKTTMEETFNSNLFSPNDLCILLQGNLHQQRNLRKITDGFHELIKRVNIGAKLYAPVLQRVQQQEDALLQLQTEENETRQMISQYLKRELTRIDHHHTSRVTRQTNNTLRQLLQYINEDETTLEAITKIIGTLHITYLNEKEMNQETYQRLLKDMTFFDLTPEKAQHLFHQAYTQYIQDHHDLVNTNTWKHLYDQYKKSEAELGWFLTLTDEEYRKTFHLPPPCSAHQELRKKKVLPRHWTAALLKLPNPKLFFSSTVNERFQALKKKTLLK